MDLFLWPWVLSLFLLTPLLLRHYRRGLRPPAESAVRHADLTLIARAAGGARRWRRHLPATFYLAACGLALVALARPTVAVPEAHPQAGIVLAVDVSRSMRTRDVAPSRFEAARGAVRSFVASLPQGARVGLVAFGGYAAQLVPLTDEHERVLEAVDLLTLMRGTAIGEALMESLEALPDLEARLQAADPASLATIVLLSDGRNRTGISPLDALAEVKRQQVRVHTVGVGSLAASSEAVPGDGFGFRGASGFDEAILRTIADETGGRYVFVESADELRDVYRDLGRAVVWRLRRDEATALAALAAAALLLVSLGVGGLGRRVH